ncbi:hypothetical protein NW759_017009 [Fusarium solani]|nr:hypothetical protein NW759_017009 [Fusarium solani]
MKSVARWKTLIVDALETEPEEGQDRLTRLFQAHRHIRTPTSPVNSRSEFPLTRSNVRWKTWTADMPEDAPLEDMENLSSLGPSPERSRALKIEAIDGKQWPGVIPSRCRKMNSRVQLRLLRNNTRRSVYGQEPQNYERKRRPMSSIVKKLKRRHRHSHRLLPSGSSALHKSGLPRTAGGINLRRPDGQSRTPRLLESALESSHRKDF